MNKADLTILLLKIQNPGICDVEFDDNFKAINYKEKYKKCNHFSTLDCEVEQFLKLWDYIDYLQNEVERLKK